MGYDFIIAIQFDSAGYAAYAFSLTSREEEGHPYIKTWGAEFGLETPKTPACILFDKQEDFIGFGYSARDDYRSKKGQEARDMFFFDCFHLAVDGKNLTKNLHIEATNGKTMSALKIFTEALRFLKDDALECINQITAERKFTTSDFTWVLIVPAFLGFSAISFMKEAATQAGIVTDIKKDRLFFTVESEAVSYWCMKLPAEGFISENVGEDIINRSQGTQYIVVVAEDRAVDFAVYEVLEGGGLKERYGSSDRNLGGQSVVRKYKEFLREIFSKGVWDEYERSCPSEVQRMKKDFSIFAQKDLNEDIMLSCPFHLGQFALKKQDIEKLFEGVQGASWDEGFIQISKEKMRSFFAHSVRGITHNLREIFNKDFNIKYILLVGALADYEILRRHITEEFADDCKVLCPFRSQEAALKGAVVLGRQQRGIQFLKSAFTYGIGVSDRFDEINHKEKRKFTNKEGEWCGGLFIKLVEVDEVVVWNKTIEFIFYPVAADQTIMNFHFYRTEKKDPRYVTEKKVEHVGSLFLNSPNTESGRRREVKLTITFDCVEMKMKIRAKDLTSESESSTKFYFM